MKTIENLVNDFVRDLRAAIAAEIAETIRDMATGRPVTTRVVSRAGGRRTPEQIKAAQEELYAVIRDNPGWRIEQIAEELGVDTESLVLPTRRLIAGKRIRATGVARGTTYTATERRAA